MEDKDLRLLTDLYKISHPSRGEYPMLNYILNYCKSIPNITFEFDHYNNLFITKSTNNLNLIPCIIAHTDEVFKDKDELNLFIKDGIIRGYSVIKDKKYHHGLGADDSNGIFVALKLLSELDDIKVCFTVEEEIGATGASEASHNINFWNNVSYLVQADRRGKSDLIIHTNGDLIVSTEFLIDIEHIYLKYDYKEQYGLFTDVGILAQKLNLCGLNVSCGYHKEHTAKEHTIISELDNCYNFIKELVTTINDRYPLLDVVEYEYSQSTEYDTVFNDFNNDHCRYCQDWDCLNCTKFSYLNGSY